MPDKMGRMILVLGVIACCFGGALAFVQAHTKVVMEERTFNETILPTLNRVFGSYQPDNPFLSDRVRQKTGEDSMGRQLFADIYFAKKNAKPLALATVVSGRGYAGEFRILVAADTKTHEIIAIKTLQQKETKNLGDRIADETDSFVKQFLGMRVESNFRMKSAGGEIDAMTGATITSVAFAKAVKSAGRLLGAQTGSSQQ